MSASYLARLAAAAAAAFQLDAPRERQMTRPCGFPPRPAVPTSAVARSFLFAPAPANNTAALSSSITAQPSVVGPLRRPPRETWGFL